MYVLDILLKFHHMPNSARRGKRRYYSILMEEDLVKEKCEKLFVGQVPKDMSESDLLPIFSSYGPVENISIIRDKVTKDHKGTKDKIIINHINT